MNLNDLFRLKGIEPSGVIVMRHRPTEPKLSRMLPSLASERSDLFNAYQQTQGEKVEKAMLGATHVASFIGHTPRSALYVGLYKIGETRPLSYDEYWAEPAYRELKQRFDLKGFTREETRQSIIWFNLKLTDFYSDWKGRLTVSWPPPELSWWRRAHRNELQIITILPESSLATPMPSWTKLDLPWSELGALPSSWRSKLSEWRGIYLIFDKSDGKSYVGSAFGSENLLGRWLGYAATGHGGNRLLRSRNPENFHFTILERVSPDTTAVDIVELEGSWKERLHTRQPFGLNDN